jgi:hypothetical protein
MTAGIARRLAPLLCGALLLSVGSPVAAQAGTPSAAVLQAEFLRRVNAAEPVRGLFVPGAKVPDLSSWRSIALLDDKAGTSLPQVIEADAVHVRLRVQVGRQLSLHNECPVVDALLRVDGTMHIWDEKGWLEATYRRSAGGWRIASLDYQAD